MGGKTVQGGNCPINEFSQSILLSSILIQILLLHLIPMSWSHTGVNTYFFGLFTEERMLSPDKHDDRKSFHSND